jgi:uncharacterized protein
MRMARDPGVAGPVIKGFAAGGFRLDEGVFHALLLSPTSANGWTPPPIEALTLEMVATVLEPVPEFLLLGTGADLVRPPVAFARAMAERGIGIEAMDSRAAARAWGILRAEGRTIAAAMYPLDA